MDLGRRIAALVLVGGASVFFLSLAVWPLWWFERVSLWTYLIEQSREHPRSTLVTRGLWLFLGLFLAVVDVELALRA